MAFQSESVPLLCIIGWPLNRKRFYCTRGFSKDGWPFSRKASPVVYDRMVFRSKASPVVSFATSVGTDGLSIESALVVFSTVSDGTDGLPIGCVLRGIRHGFSRDGWPFNRKASPCRVLSDWLAAESVPLLFATSGGDAIDRPWIAHCFMPA